MGEGPAASGWAKTLQGYWKGVKAEVQGIDSPEMQRALTANAIAKQWMNSGRDFIDASKPLEGWSHSGLNKAKILDFLNTTGAGVNDLGAFAAGELHAKQVVEAAKAGGLDAVGAKNLEDMRRWRTPEEQIQKLGKMTPEEEERFIRGFARDKAAYEQIVGQAPVLQTRGQNEGLLKWARFATNYTWTTTKRTVDNIYEIYSAYKAGDTERGAREVRRFLNRVLGYELAGIAATPLISTITGKDRSKEDWPEWLLKNLAYTAFFGYGQIFVDAAEKLAGVDNKRVSLRVIGNPSVQIPLELLDKAAGGDPGAGVYGASGHLRPALRSVGLGPSEKGKAPKGESAYDRIMRKRMGGGSPKSQGSAKAGETAYDRIMRKRFGGTAR